MDPVSLLVGAMAGAIIAVVVMALLRSGDGDYERALDETENAPQQDGGLTTPDKRRLH